MMTPSSKVCFVAAAASSAAEALSRKRTSVRVDNVVENVLGNSYGCIQDGKVPEKVEQGLCGLKKQIDQRWASGNAARIVDIWDSQVMKGMLTAVVSKGWNSSVFDNNTRAIKNAVYSQFDFPKYRPLRASNSLFFQRMLRRRERSDPTMEDNEYYIESTQMGSNLEDTGDFQKLWHAIDSGEISDLRTLKERLMASELSVGELNYIVKEFFNYKPRIFKRDEISWGLYVNGFLFSDYSYDTEEKLLETALQKVFQSENIDESMLQTSEQEASKVFFDKDEEQISEWVRSIVFGYYEEDKERIIQKPNKFFAHFDMDKVKDSMPNVEKILKEVLTLVKASAGQGYEKRG